jgi:hypothetical protein
MEKKKTPYTDVHHAWVWDCEGCGAENFARSTVFALSEREKEHSDPSGVEFWQTAPTLVECWSCGTEYKCRLDLPGMD